MGKFWHPSWWGFLFCAFATTACDNSSTQPIFHEEGYPPLLSDWNVIIRQGDNLELVANTIPYDLATPLFSDYALKLRTITLPDGQPATYNAKRTFDFPVGTIITKTFYYHSPNSNDMKIGDDREIIENTLSLHGLRLIETRILAHRDEGWIALPYVWNAEQTEATLKRTGSIIPLILNDDQGNNQEFSYLTPNQNQCAGCHATNNTTRAIEPIGPKARHLNKPSSFVNGFNQLDHWVLTGLLEGDFTDADNAPRNAIWSDDLTAFNPQELDKLARSYLDANCSHCHNPNGSADTSGLNLEPNARGIALGICKNPIAAGAGSGGFTVDIAPGHADDSIFIYRMDSTDPGSMMPELGRALVHKEGVTLIRAWINAMDGTCT